MPKRTDSPFMRVLNLYKQLEPSEKKLAMEAMTCFADAPAVKATPRKASKAKGQPAEPKA